VSPLREVFSGTLWVVGARWGIRAIGLVSTVVLARLLSPADFGVVALAMLVVVGFEVFSYTGTAIYIIRHPDPQRSHFDTVFTIQLIVGGTISVLVFLAAPLGAAFFTAPEAEPVIRALALRPLLYAVENPGIIWFRKNMRFSKDFEFMVVNKLAAFAITITAALVFRSYWALVAGILAGGAIGVAQSYLMHPFRPRLSLAEIGMVWRFSSWMLVANLLEFINTKMDEIIIGRLHSTTDMGFYNVGADIAATPVQEVIYPMTRVWEPAFAKLARDRAALEQTYRWVISAVAIVALSVGTGLALVAHDFALIVLGPKWLPAVPVIQVLALAAGMAAMAMPLGSVLAAAAHPRITAGLGLARTVLLLCALLPAAMLGGLPEVAAGRAVATAAVLMVTYVVFERTVGLAPLTLARGLVRPLLAALAMSAVVLAVRAASPDIAILRLVLCAATGAVAFVAALLALWLLAGRPASVEADALRWLAARRATPPPPPPPAPGPA
jgi:O-antigen/teichoic acid export membrane protein